VLRGSLLFRACDQKERYKKLQQITGFKNLDDFLELLLDPVTGPPANGKKVTGLLLIHVDDPFSRELLSSCNMSVLKLVRSIR